MRTWALAVALVLAAGSAHAQSAEGYGALALAAIVGGESPQLSAAQKTVLAQLFSGDTASSSAGKIDVAVDTILCRAGNVDITAFACDLTFGAQTIHLTGRSAHEFFATLAEMGVQPDGAAGTMYRGIYKVRCTIDPNGVAQKDGGGANCAYARNPS
ncbi:MAG TPA: hypothetical protein VN805_01850 [Caulobacteraceae bacterium]|nr:hypothetical protein [Caulobacteraceae bacterium]